MHARTPKVAVHEDARKCTKVHKSARRCTQDSAPYLDGPDTPNSTKLILFMLFGTYLTNIYCEWTRKKQKNHIFFKPEKCSGKCSLRPGGAHIFCWKKRKTWSWLCAFPSSWPNQPALFAFQDILEEPERNDIWNKKIQVKYLRGAHGYIHLVPRRLLHD